MPGPIHLAQPTIVKYVCSDGHEPVTSTLNRCWYCGKPARRIKAKGSTRPGETVDPNGWRWWKCSHLLCEAVGDRYWGPHLAPCPECGHPGARA